MQLQQTLNNMIGGLFIYNAFQHKVLQARANADGSVTIATDREIIQLEPDDAADEIKRFLPVENEIETKALEVIPRSNNGRKLSDIVMQQIEKVEADPAHIPQAQTINNSVNTLLKIAKTELEILKMRQKAGA